MTIDAADTSHLTVHALADHSPEKKPPDEGPLNAGISAATVHVLFALGSLLVCTAVGNKIIP